MRYERYTVIIEPDEEEPHRYNVHVPALPGCLTYGESIDDALTNAVEAIQGYVAVVVAQGHSVPVERQPAMAATIAVPLVDVPDNAELEMAGVGIQSTDSEGVTTGESIEDALANAHEAIVGYVESLLADGEPIPRETHPAIAATIVVILDAA